MIRYLERKRWISIILTILVGIEIFYFSSLKENSSISGVSIISVIYHFTIFFLFSFFLITSFSENKKLDIKNIFIAIVISILYAVLDEIHQIFVPFRSASVEDVLIDITGIFSSVIIYLYSMGKN